MGFDEVTNNAINDTLIEVHDFMREKEYNRQL